MVAPVREAAAVESSGRAALHPVHLDRRHLADGAEEGKTR